jgi:hypothetical protein
MDARACVVALLLAGGVAAQQDSDFRVQSNVVQVPALVKDADGHIVYGLKQKDFIIEDDGAEQSVRLDDSAESEPASVVVAVQTGRRAMREFPRMRGIGPMLTAVFNQLQSRVALVEFDSHVTWSKTSAMTELQFMRISRNWNPATVEQQFEMPSNFRSACWRRNPPPASACCS